MHATIVEAFDAQYVFAVDLEVNVRQAAGVTANLWFPFVSESYRMAKMVRLRRLCLHLHRFGSLVRWVRDGPES
jgi:hypothetical protein